VFVAKAQLLAASWASDEPAANVTALIHWLGATPSTRCSQARSGVVIVLATVAAEAFRLTREPCPLPFSNRCVGTASRIRNFVMLMRSEYSNGNADLDRFAVALNVSRCRLSHLVNERTGYGVTEHRAIWRILGAVLLLTQSYSIKQIAHRLGYRGTPELDRQFHRWTRMTPGEYRNALTMARADRAISYGIESLLKLATLQCALGVGRDVQLTHFRG
jgi:AraC-like DNA-binding protein